MEGVDCIDAAVNKLVNLAPDLEPKRAEVSVIMVQLLGDYLKERGEVPAPQGKITR
jgi:hypothetical protein